MPYTPPHTHTHSSAHKRHYTHLHTTTITTINPQPCTQPPTGAPSHPWVHTPIRQLPSPQPPTNCHPITNQLPPNPRHTHSRSSEGSIMAGRKVVGHTSSGWQLAITTWVTAWHAMMPRRQAVEYITWREGGSGGRGGSQAGDDAEEDGHQLPHPPTYPPGKMPAGWAAPLGGSGRWPPPGGSKGVGGGSMCMWTSHMCVCVGGGGAYLCGREHMHPLLVPHPSSRVRNNTHT